MELECVNCEFQCRVFINFFATRVTRRNKQIFTIVAYELNAES